MSNYNNLNIYVDTLADVVELRQVAQQLHGLLAVWHEPRQALGQDGDQEHAQLALGLLDHRVEQSQDSPDKLVTGDQPGHMLVQLLQWCDQTARGVDPREEQDDGQ